VPGHLTERRSSRQTASTSYLLGRTTSYPTMISFTIEKETYFIISSAAKVDSASCFTLFFVFLSLNYRPCEIESCLLLHKVSQHVSLYLIGIFACAAFLPPSPFHQSNQLERGCCSDLILVEQSFCLSTELIFPMPVSNYHTEGEVYCHKKQCEDPDIDME
jgi:hypothetical protein